MRWLFAPIVPFVSHPGRIAVVAVIWFVAAAALTLWQKKLAWPPMLAGIAWGLFAAWERHCVTMGHNIRVDLMLIYPVLVAMTLLGLAGIIVADARQFTIRRRFSLRGLLIVTTFVALALGLIVWYVR